MNRGRRTRRWSRKPGRPAGKRKLNGGGVRVHEYYRCANNHPDESHPTVRRRQDDLEDAIVADLETIRIPNDDLSDWFRTTLQAALRATGTNDLRQFCVAPTVAPTLYKSCPNESFPVKTTGRGSQRNRNRDDDEHPLKSSEKASFAGVANEALKIGMTAAGLNPGQQPATCMPRRSSPPGRGICRSWRRSPTR
jgi:hypothetical protein